ncbi:MAG: IS66 family insertion sequence element accessory protein TnpB [Actinobacteria bacterium]|nr:IS66 family insertion sequence element accessory protein TnpB [Actinomycetota bacterium]
MLSLSFATRVYVAVQPVDLRLSFNGLLGWVQKHLEVDPLSGHLFVFTNRSRNRLKILFWDGSGLWVCAKRLERGTFAWPKGEDCSRTLLPEELGALASGLQVTGKRTWYRS